MTTLEQILLHLGELKGTLAGVDEKLDAVIGAAAKHEANDETRFEDVDKRLAEIDKIRWRIAGAAGGAVLIANFAWRFFL